VPAARRQVGGGPGAVNAAAPVHPNLLGMIAASDLVAAAAR
jgi:hypothetical protein